MKERVTAEASDESVLDDPLFRAAGGLIVHDLGIGHPVSLPQQCGTE
jgi:hypothetical protein